MTTTTATHSVQFVEDPFDPTNEFGWAIVDLDGGVCDRFDTEADALAALAAGGYSE